MKTCGIYKLENIVNNKVYIGQSIEIERRKKRHFNELKCGNHINKHLQRAFDKYGESNFRHEIIEECDLEYINNKERFWIMFYKSNDYNFGYNQDSGGQEGKIMNEDTRARIGKSREYPSGCDTSNALFNEQEITDIKYMIIDGFEIKDIAIKYNVRNDLIIRIRDLKTYAEFAEELNEILFMRYGNDDLSELEYLSYEASSSQIDEDIEIIKPIVNLKEYLYKNQVKDFSELAKNLNITRQEILDIAKCITYKHILPEYNDELKCRYNKRDRKPLTKKEVEEIKRLLSLDNKSITNKSLGEKYNIDVASISNIKLLKIYKNVASEYNEMLFNLHGTFKDRKILSEEEVIQIKELLLQEKYYKHKELGDMFGVDGSQISRIKNLKIYEEYGSQYNERLIKKYGVSG